MKPPLSLLPTMDVPATGFQVDRAFRFVVVGAVGGLCVWQFVRAWRLNHHKNKKARGALISRILALISIVFSFIRAIDAHSVYGIYDKTTAYMVHHARLYIYMYIASCGCLIFSYLCCSLCVCMILCVWVSVGQFHLRLRTHIHTRYFDLQGLNFWILVTAWPSAILAVIMYMQALTQINIFAEKQGHLGEAARAMARKKVAIIVVMVIECMGLLVLYGCYIPAKDQESVDMVNYSQIPYICAGILAISTINVFFDLTAYNLWKHLTHSLKGTKEGTHDHTQFLQVKKKVKIGAICCNTVAVAVFVLLLMRLTTQVIPDGEAYPHPNAAGFALLNESADPVTVWMYMAEEEEAHELVGAIDYKFVQWTLKDHTSLAGVVLSMSLLWLGKNAEPYKTRAQRKAYKATNKSNGVPGSHKQQKGGKYDNKTQVITAAQFINGEWRRSISTMNTMNRRGSTSTSRASFSTRSRGQGLLQQGAHGKLAAPTVTGLHIGGELLDVTEKPTSATREDEIKSWAVTPMLRETTLRDTLSAKPTYASTDVDRELVPGAAQTLISLEKAPDIFSSHAME